MDENVKKLDPFHRVAASRYFAGGGAGFTYKRMTALPQTVRKIEGGPVVRPESHVSVKQVSRPLQWSMAGPPQVTRDPRHPRFSRVKAHSVTVQTEGDVDGWLDAAAAQFAVLEAQADGPLQRFLISELPVWRKQSVQRGMLMSAFTGTQGPGYGTLTLPGVVHDIARHVVSVYKRYYRPFVSGSDPSTTNSGWPCFQSGPAAKLVGMLPFTDQMTSAQASDLAQAFSVQVGLPVEAAGAYGFATRSGPMYKPAPEFLLRSGSWVATEERTGNWQRNRVVQMAWAGSNRRLRRLFDHFHSARMNIPGLWRKGDADWSYIHGFGAYMYEGDISGFDTSLVPELQAVLADAIAFSWPELSADAEFWLWSEALPLIGPDYNLDSRGASVVSVGGGIRSGSKFTAEQGTAIATVCDLYGLHRLGYDYREWPLSDKFRTVHQGDDILTSTKKKLDPHAYSAACLELGLKVDLIEGQVFLSRHQLPTGSAPLSGRLVQQTMSNEHERTGKGALGIAYLGYIARTHGASLLPAELQSAAWSVISEAAWVRGLPAAARSGLLPLREYLMSDPGIADIIGDALKSTEGSDWLTIAMREAEHSSTAVQIVKFAEKVGVSTTDLQGLDRTLALLSEAAATLPERERMSWAFSGYSAVMTGQEHGWFWLQQIADRLKINVHPTPAASLGDDHDNPS